MVHLKDSPEAFDMLLSGIRLGPFVLVGIPGKPFNAVGRAIKDTDGYGMIIPCCLTNGGEGYFPMQDSYEEGEYETRSSKFKAGVAKHIIAETKTLLSELEAAN